MSNISITDSQLNEMLKKLSLENIEDLFEIIPNKFKYDINSLSLKDARKVFEQTYLKEQLKRFKGSIAKTSTFIGMDRSALHRKLKELDIDIKNFD